MFDGPTFHLRSATNADCAAVQKLVFGVLAEFGLTADPRGTDADLNDLEGVFAGAGGSFDVLVDEAGGIVGTVGLCRVSETVAELRKMYISRDVRGCGLGRRLLAHALTRATALGFRRVILETASVLSGAIALYERHGFRRYEPEHLAARCDAAYFLDLPWNARA